VSIGPRRSAPATAIESGLVPPPSPDPSAGVSRRVVLAGLAAAAGAALVGCTEEGQPPRPKAQPSPVVASVDPDVAVAAEALASQQEILDLLEATGRRHRDLSAQLAPVVAAHKAHADLLADAVPEGVSVSPSPTPGPRSPGRHAVPRSRAGGLAEVVEAEQQLATVTKRQAFRAESGAFARLLGSMAAAAAQSAAALVFGGGTGGTS
jgi:hypothetical protein